MIVDSYFTDRRSKLKTMHQRLVVSRVYTSISIFISVLTMVFEPASILGQSVMSTEIPMIWVVLSLILCGMAFCDVLINDIAPEKYSFQFAHDNRHIVYMCLATLSFSISVSILTSYGTSLALCRLWLDGCISVAVAILDILGRHGRLNDTSVHHKYF